MKIRSIILTMVATGCLIASVGCKQQSTTTTSSSTTKQSAADDHGHDHPHGDSTDHSVAGHGHGIGPHDGTIADWGGGKFHVEFTVDHEKQQATVYVLGSDEKTATPIDAESIALSITDPQMQVTLNTRQHVMLNVGVRLPLNEAESRDAELVVYVLWDWFDGGFFDGW